MHPDLYLVAYHAERRQLEEQLRHRLAAERRPGPGPRTRGRYRLTTLARALSAGWATAVRSGAPGSCCPATA